MEGAASAGTEALSAPPDIAPSPPTAETFQPRGRTRLEALLEIIVAEQQVQAERINRLQASLEALRSRLDTPLPLSPAPSRGALSPEAHERLTEVALEAQLLNQQAAILVRQHDQHAAVAQRRGLTDPVLTVEVGSQGDNEREPAWEARAAPQSGQERPLRPAASGSRSVDVMDFALDAALSDADFAALLAEAGAAATAVNRLGHLMGSQPAPTSALSELPRAVLDDACQGAACPVCLAELGGDPVCLLPCGTKQTPHAFHPACILQWLQRRNSCPVCRSALSESCAALPFV